MGREWGENTTEGVQVMRSHNLNLINRSAND
jgi:hypothetical protein